MMTHDVLQAGSLWDLLPTVPVLVALGMQGVLLPAGQLQFNAVPTICR
jgi:hypothetical protein